MRSGAAAAKSSPPAQGQCDVTMTGRFQYHRAEAHLLACLNNLNGDYCGILPNRGGLPQIVARQRRIVAINFVSRCREKSHLRTAFAHQIRPRIVAPARRAPAGFDGDAQSDVD